MNCVRTVNHAIKGQFYKRIIGSDHYITWSLSYNSFVKFHLKNSGARTDSIISKCVKTRCVIKRLHCIYIYTKYHIVKI